jgi:hypothetical protein
VHQPVAATQLGARQAGDERGGQLRRAQRGQVRGDVLAQRVAQADVGERGRRPPRS